MKKIILDSHQSKIQKVLKQLVATLDQNSSNSPISKLFSSKENLKSLYIHGDVGRGKSMLMKECFGNIKKTPKLYFHFNSFMRQIHEALRDIRKEPKKFKDELIEATKRVSNCKKLICLDEFQVTDIADAMLLSRIFSYLFSKNTVVIFTSNSEPSGLYKNGLQRELFLEFVKNTLLKNCQILNLNSPTDYRAKYTKNLSQRYFLANEKSDLTIKEIIKNLTNNNSSKGTEIMSWGRKITIKETYDNNIAVINFKDLCQTNHSASDYQAICGRFNLIFLMNLPQLSKEDSNEAKRLMLFIDEIYENKTALIISAKTITSEIYIHGTGSEAFKRTVSRLQEIKSDTYWQTSKINT